MTGESIVELKPGTVLPNGAVVIEASCREAHTWIILAMRPGLSSGDDPFVTWKCKRPGDGSDTVWGHYFGSLRDAVDDYYGRT